MSEELVVQGAELAPRQKAEIVRLDTEQIKFLAHTEFVPDRIRGNLPAIFATIATGREIGIGDMAALRHIHNIDGKPGYSAEIMVARVRQEGHSVTGEVTEGSAIVRGKRKDNGDEMTSTWTLAMADRAGLLGKGNWKKYPEAMLWARAASQLCRMLFSDCLAGATYTAEELGAEHTDEHGEVLEPVDMSDPAIPFGDHAHPQLMPPEPKMISTAQRTRLFTIAGNNNVDETRLRAIVLEATGQESTKNIPAGAVYDAVVAQVEAQAP